MKAVFDEDRKLLVLALIGAACMGLACEPPTDEKQIACEGYCDGLLSCGEGWEIGIDGPHDCADICYVYTEERELFCIDHASGCDDVRRCLCFPLYEYLYESCSIFFTDDGGDYIELEEVVSACESDDAFFGFDQPISDCLVGTGSCMEIDDCLDDLLGD
jgi:hypothetical protein